MAPHPLVGIDLGDRYVIESDILCDHVADRYFGYIEIRNGLVNLYRSGDKSLTKGCQTLRSKHLYRMAF